MGGSMQHPFAGVLDSDQAANAGTVKLEDSIASRRTLLGVLAGIVAAGTFGLLSTTKVQAQPTTYAAGEEGGRGMTTYAVGEEGGAQPTTYAVGEEGGAEPTTHAVGEEGGRRRPPVRVRG